MGIFVNAAALHDIPHLATIGHRAVLSQVISGVGPDGADRVTVHSGAFTERIGDVRASPYQRMANPS
ncbi:hypothetical protein [Streptomyces sp. NPDC058629]|uniref:hypothetical protein n=1 Tax=Streptomyces sp. NPDC058629 TaxID=3346565 RepID=UPI0036594AD1